MSMADPSVVEPASPSDADVISEVCAGDRARFGILVRRYNQRLFRTARAIVGDDAEAEDVVQQTYLDAFRNLGQFRGEAAFSTWLTRIAVHVAISRSHKRRRLAEVVADAEAAPMETIADSAYAAVADRELARLIERHIDRLPDGLRIVLVLRDLEELDTAQTADALDISPEAVRVRLHRARAELRASVDAELDRELGSSFRFLGTRCDRMYERVMAAIESL
jgi:RNA polymerase sigma-70 factor (ECF subfamily)